MKIQLAQLTQSLKSNLASLYLVSGDELLLVQEACATIREHATSQGYTPQEKFYVEPNFNWDNFLLSTTNLSLWTERSLIELQLKNPVTAQGSATLQRYAKNPDPNKIILITSSKLDTAQQKSSWVKAIATQGIMVSIWPIDPPHLPAWISQRLRQYNLSTDSAGINLLAEHAAGNLLALAQEIEKLQLLYPNQRLTATQILEVITDNTRFNIFDLLDTALSGNFSLLLRILNNIKKGGGEPAMLLWLITRELRTLIVLKETYSSSKDLAALMAEHNIWPKRHPLVKKALLRHNLASLQELLHQAATIDYLLKGATTTKLLWPELYQLYLALAHSSNHS